MELETARARLARLTAASEDPVLSDEDLDLLLAETALVTDDGVTLYRLHRAAYAAWLSKAALVANRYDYAGDGQSFRRSQMLAQFLTMAQLYRRGVKGSLRIARLSDAERLLEHAPG